MAAINNKSQPVIDLLNSDVKLPRRYSLKAMLGATAAVCLGISVEEYNRKAPLRDLQSAYDSFCTAILKARCEKDLDLISLRQETYNFVAALDNYIDFHNKSLFAGDNNSNIHFVSEFCPRPQSIQELRQEDLIKIQEFINKPLPEYSLENCINILQDCRLIIHRIDRYLKLKSDSTNQFV